ncbi:hypothetical protein HY639_03630 [Candidatus Woesearchaeota archaeon]|nr:hypothetical protein [Candidatus Woesearchaeota archaeon]
MKHELNWRALAVTFGLFNGVYFGLSTLIAMSGLQVMGFSRDLFELLRSAFPMITPTYGGIFAALGLGLVCGTVCGSIVSWLYNSLQTLPANIMTYGRIGRLVLGIILVYAGNYAGGVGGGAVLFIGTVCIMEAIVGYCYLLHLLRWKA